VGVAVPTLLAVESRVNPVQTAALPEAWRLPP
jgi:hypothetical protein